jgi:chromosome segregation ATPase
VTARHFRWRSGVTLPHADAESTNPRRLSFGTSLEPGCPPGRRQAARHCNSTFTRRKEFAVLNDAEVKRIVDAITEYRELVQQSTDMRDQLESLQKRWSSLRAERDQVRTSIDTLHQTLAQLKVDYQAVMKRMTDLSSTEDTVLDNVKFLIDELTSVLKKHEG